MTLSGTLFDYYLCFQAHLLCCIQQCLIKSNEIRKKQQLANNDDDDADDEDDDLSVQSELEKMMKSLTDRLITSEMEDFELVSNRNL